ncbi:MAG: response regulator transcription factor [Fibrobacter sp.]|jgi:DNA-binding response OmpR family regulator|nr:response regulator transcription factor [Fibrobacter sp.]
MDGFKIMIIDDDPVIRELLYFNLTARGYEVISCATGQKALEMFTLEKPDLILLDVMMPEMDGWEVLKILRDHYDSNDVKILMLTAKSTERDKLIGKSILKADEYVTKPFDLESLLKLIAESLQQE